MSFLTRRPIHFISFALTLISSLATAQSLDRITFGPEFEFTHQSMQKPVWGLNGEEYKAAKRLALHMKKKCVSNGCRVSVLKDGKWGNEFKVTFADGWWYTISYDPWCVEIQAKPSTLSELKARRPILQSMIFESAHEIGLVVDPVGGAGHFNFGALSAFGGNSRAFLRYFVDFANHPELSMGIFRPTNLINAPPVATLPFPQRLALKKIVEEFNGGRTMNIHDLFERIQREVYATSPWMPPNDPDPPHYQALGIYSAAAAEQGADAPIGNRAVRAQQDIDEFILMAEYHTMRLHHLRSLDLLGFPIEYDPGLERVKEVYAPFELLQRYKEHIQEMGGNWTKFRNLMPLSLRNFELFDFKACPELVISF